jgi:cell division protein ZapA
LGGEAWLRDNTAVREIYVTVEIYDQVYHLSGQDTDHIRELAARVDAKMRAVAAHGRTVDSLRVAVLAALNLADELSQAGIVDSQPGHARAATLRGLAGRSARGRAEDGIVVFFDRSHAVIEFDGVLEDQHVGDADIEGKLKKMVARAAEMSNRKPAAVASDTIRQRKIAKCGVFHFGPVAVAGRAKNVAHRARLAQGLVFFRADPYYPQ